MSVRILVGDCRERLRELPDESVHCVVTSPPYWGLRDYGVGKDAFGLEPTYQLYVERAVETFREVRRVLRADGTLWLNLGDSYARMQEGNVPQSKNLKCQPPIMAGRIKNAGLKSKDLCGIPWRVAFALQADGWWLRQDIIWSKPNPMPESVTDRCTKAHEYLFLLSKSERYYFDNDAIAEDLQTAPGENYPARAKITGRGLQGAADARGNDRDQSGGFPPKRSGNKARKPATERGCPKGGVAGSIPWEGFQRNKRSVWTVGTAPFCEAHFATFPPALIEPCILAGCPKGGTVLDPFGGAGTTGLVADRLNRNAILIELNPEYADMAERRISGDAGMFGDVTSTGTAPIPEQAVLL